MKSLVRFILVLLLLNFIESNTNAQNFADKKHYLIDSLILNQISDEDKKTIDVGLAEFHNSTSDTTKVKAIMSIVEQSWEEQVWVKYNNWAYVFIKDKLTKKNHDVINRNLRIRLGQVLNNKGYFAQYSLGNISSALHYYEESLAVYTEEGDNNSIAGVLNNLAFVYSEQGDIQKSLNYYNRSLSILEKGGNKKELAMLLNNVADVYQGQGDYSKGLELNNKALNIQKEVGDSSGMATTLNNIGSAYTRQKEFDKALVYFLKVKSILIGILDENRMSIVFNNIGDVYEKLGDKTEALSYYQKSLVIKEKVGNKSGEAHSLFKIGNLLFTDDKLIEAETYTSKSLLISKGIGFPKSIQKSTFLLSQIYEKQGRGIEALGMYKLSIKMRDSLRNESTLRATIQQQTKYEYDKQKTIDDLSHEKELVIEQEEKEKQRVITIAVTGGLIMLALFLIYIYRRLKITQVQKVEIIEKKELVESQKEALELAHNKLEEATGELRDSINYAELIQDAVLPTLRIEDLTKESFIYFNPKEKVSGDFYWIEQKDEYNGYAVADCTGHGIPGAFISMIGTILLNEIYNSKEIYVPNEILDELSRLVRLTLTNKDGSTMKDGMDISFVVLDNKTKMLYFSGANNPIWIASKNSEKRINKGKAVPLTEKDGKYIYEIKGDKQPIGDYRGKTKPFTLNSAHLEEGDVFYLFSDGYADQFGGNKNKKFKTKPFRELLLSVFEKNMEEQKFSLNENFQNWKGSFEQIDDVTVMGVRV